MESPAPDTIRVLFVDNSFEFGGAILSLADLVGRLPEFGVEPVVVSAQPADALTRLFPNAAFRSQRIPMSWVDPDPFVGTGGAEAAARLSRPIRLLRGVYWTVRGEVRPALRFRELGRQHRVHLVHLNNSPRSQTAAAIAARLLGVPCVAHSRGVPGIATGTDRLRYALPDLHIGISTAVTARLQINGVPASKVRTIHNPVNLDHFTPGEPPSALREEMGISPTRRVIGLFGRIVPFKGVLEFLRAFAVVVRSVPSATALIVGDRSDGPAEYEMQVRALIGELGLGNHVVMPGFRQDVADLLRLCDVLALTSLGDEGFGRVLVEAMACGVPVVATNSGGPLDIVREGVDGHLRDPRDTAAFADALIALLGNDEERAQFGARARIHAVHHFSSHAHAEQVARAYRTLLGRE